MWESRNIAWFALLAAAVVATGCSSTPGQPRTAADRQAVRQQQPAAPPTQQVRTAWPNPEQEAAKIGVRLYPGAQAYREQYSIRRGNSDLQYAFFITPDSKEKVAEFYSSAYQVEFRPNDKGHLAALVQAENSPDTYLFELFEIPGGNTDIHVTRVHSCDTYSSQEPCDTTQ